MHVTSVWLRDLQAKNSLFFFLSHPPPPELSPFPPPASLPLPRRPLPLHPHGPHTGDSGLQARVRIEEPHRPPARLSSGVPSRQPDHHTGLPTRSGVGHRLRSEEHTSELQSQSNLVCRLLLEKK